MKYSELNLGQIEAMVNKLGGMNGVHRLLSGVAFQFVGNPTFPLNVNPRVSLRDRIAAGHYDWWNENILKWRREDQPVYTGESPVSVVVEYSHFNKDISTDEAEHRMTETGYRLANLEELLAHGEKNPDEQRQFPIVALGSVFVGPQHGSRCSPSLGGGVSGRKLSLDYRDDDWNADCRFAGVRKDAVKPGPSV